MTDWSDVHLISTLHTDLCTIHNSYRSTEYVSWTTFINKTGQEQNSIDLLCNEE